MESPFANLFTRPPSTVAKLRSQRRHMGGAAATGVLSGGRGRSEVGAGGRRAVDRRPGSASIPRHAAAAAHGANHAHDEFGSADLR
jgi:hypothetical protein